MVAVRHVPVGVVDGLVDMAMAVWLARWILRAMGMTMVFVVHVAMVMVQRFVGVLVLVPLG